MIVTNELFSEVLTRLGDFSSVDTETTGLFHFLDDELFSLILSDDKENYYFNFKPYVSEGAPFLDRSKLQNFVTLFADPNRSWFLQNAKFDMHMLAREGIFIAGKVYDLMIMDRIIYNQHLKYNLDSIGARYGHDKDDRVLAYIKEHKLISTRRIHGITKESETYHYDRVPFSLMSEYGQKDGEITASIGHKMLAKIEHMDAISDPLWPKQTPLLDNECKLTKTLFSMEHHGVLIDVDFCWKAVNFYNNVTNTAATEFKEITGFDFVKGTTVFEQVFESEKDKWIKTEKGEWCWDKHQIERFMHPAARLVNNYAEAKKQLEYFENFLFFVDKNNVIHPNFNQAGTVTSRLSASNPNFQNLSNPDKYDEDSEASMFPVRAAIIPRPGTFLLSVDYSQVEFRVFLDYSKATNLIDEIDKGLDVHTATANIAGISRKEAKTTNFLTLYGGGVAKLCMQLYKPRGTQLQIGAIYKDMYGWNMSDEETEALKTIPKDLYAFNEPLIRKAYDVREAIFKAAPQLKSVMKDMQNKALKRGYSFDWLGRRYQISDPKWAYKAPNHIIQGASAQIIKVAMNRISDYLQDKKAKMILSIHDELIFEVPVEETFIVDEIKQIMRTSYPHKLMKLEVDAEFSFNNLADKIQFSEENFMHEQAKRNQVQGESDRPIKNAEEHVVR